MIRHATILDTPKILALTKEFYPETPYAKWIEFDDETVTNLIHLVMRKGIFLVAQVEDELVGILGVIGAPFMFNSNYTICSEVVWWVAPAHRQGTLGRDLLRRVDQLRQLKGWVYFQMTRLETSNPVLDRFFKKEGFLPTEYCFTKVN